LIAARERATGGSINARGGTGKLVAYASAHTHSSLEKAIRIAGIGVENLHIVDVDSRWAMRAEVLEQRIRSDREAGMNPFFVCATVGTTSSNAIDPVRAIGEICTREGIWLHVDAAMAGTAALCPELRFIHDGLELVDSYAFNPHKWMFTNFDCDCFYVRDKQALINALTILPEYLRNQPTESGAVIDYRDWQVSLGRRFRSLKLWFVIRHYGVEGLRHHVREHVALAQTFAGWVQADDRFELVTPPPLNLVCFRYRGNDAQNQNLLNELNTSGELYLTHTKLDDRFTLRFCVGQTMTQRHHVERAWEKIRTTAARIN
jgi:aromatic-L-amino-acid decarboxylase